MILMWTKCKLTKYFEGMLHPVEDCRHWYKEKANENIELETLLWYYYSCIWLEGMEQSKNGGFFLWCLFQRKNVGILISTWMSFQINMHEE